MFWSFKQLRVFFFYFFNFNILFSSKCQERIASSNVMANDRPVIWGMLIWGKRAAIDCWTGKAYILSAAYPTKRMEDEELEKKIVELINVHLYPDIVFKILKYLARNVHDADSNLYLAFLITSDEVIKSIYDTFSLFKKDIFEADRNKRTLNVKRIQQFPPATDHRFSSPLDAAARFKYVLEFIAMKQNVEHIYKKSDLSLTGIDA